MQIQGRGTQIQGHGTQIQGRFSPTDYRCLLLLTTFSSSSCSFYVLFALSFSRLILSLSPLCSSVTEALSALCFSFLSERCCFFGFFFDHAKAALPYTINEQDAR